MWSDHVRDGVIFRGHPKFRNGQKRNDWFIIEWLSSADDDDSETPSLVEGQILSGFYFKRGPSELTSCSRKWAL